MARWLVAGNWKMNGLVEDGRALAEAIARHLDAAPGAEPDVVVCPPAPLLPLVASAIEGSGVELGAQDCHQADSGAHTGDTSAALIASVGCRYVIVGHSERRADHGESDELVRAKAEAAQRAGLVPIVCVGESLAEREAGKAERIVSGQIEGSLPDSGPAVVAYEPVWAIGTGKTATPRDVATMHGHIHALLETRYGGEHAKAVPILYGGSVKPGNAAELFAAEHVRGALVGGASLEAGSFWEIVTAARTAAG